MNPVEEYIERLPPDQRPLWHHLRWTILESGEHISEAIKYRLPFFLHKKRIWIYLNPVKGGIDVSFMDGTLMKEQAHIMRNDGRKRVSSYRVESVEDLNQEELVALIQSSLNLRATKK